MIENKIKGVVFGIGRNWKAINPYIKKDFEIKAYMDNFKIGGGVYNPNKWEELDFDKIVICAFSFRDKLDMMNQLLDLGVEKERIGFIEEFQKNYDICIQVVKQNTINIISNDIVIQCENEIEFMIAQEIFAKEEYGFHMEENYFVIDIGMNIGCTSLYFASKDNVTYVYGFEPCETVYNKAMNNIYKNDKKIQNKIKTYNIGLSGKNGVEKYIAHHGIFESAGIKKVQEGTEHSDNIINIEVNQASNILKSIFSYHSEKCLMKLDCEGAEYEILEDLIKSNIISKVDVIIMEWHVGKYKQLENLMKICGFKFLLNKNDRDFGMCYAWR